MILNFIILCQLLMFANIFYINCADKLKILIIILCMQLERIAIF